MTALCCLQIVFLLLLYPILSCNATQHNTTQHNTTQHERDIDETNRKIIFLYFVFCLRLWKEGRFASTHARCTRDFREEKTPNRTQTERLMNRCDRFLWAMSGYLSVPLLRNFESHQQYLDQVVFNHALCVISASSCESGHSDSGFEGISNFDNHFDERNHEIFSWVVDVDGDDFCRN